MLRRCAAGEQGDSYSRPVQLPGTKAPLSSGGRRGATAENFETRVAAVCEHPRALEATRSFQPEGMASYTVRGRDRKPRGASLDDYTPWSRSRIRSSTERFA